MFSIIPKLPSLLFFTTPLESESSMLFSLIPIRHTIATVAAELPNFDKLSFAMTVLGICSVICALCYSIAIIWASNNKLKAVKHKQEDLCQY
jgi:hypothetical protein